MNLLIAGLAVFILLHLLPSFPAMRQSLIAKIGAGAYKGIFSLLSVVGIVLMVYGLKSAPTIPWYDPPTWGRHANFALMLVAIYLFLSNPLGPAPSSAKYLTAHPLSWGVIFWSGGHLLANGDKAHVLLFGSFLLFSIISIYTGNLRGQKPALDKRPSILAEAAFIIIVLVVYVGLFGSHRFFTGMPLV